MNDIKTLLITTLFLGVGGGMLYYFKNNDNSDELADDASEDKKQTKKQTKKQKKNNNFDEIDGEYNDENDKYEEKDHDDETEEKFVHFKDNKNKAKTRRNKKKLTVSKRRYY
jgi:hypothetical protein